MYASELTFSRSRSRCVDLHWRHIALQAEQWRGRIYSVCCGFSGRPGTV